MCRSPAGPGFRDVSRFVIVGWADRFLSLRAIQLADGFGTQFARDLLQFRVIETTQIVRRAYAVQQWGL